MSASDSQIAATQVTQKTQAVLILLQNLQYLPLIVLNPVNLTLKLHQELQPVVQIVRTLSRIGSQICHGMYS